MVGQIKKKDFSDAAYMSNFPFILLFTIITE